MKQYSVIRVNPRTIRLPRKPRFFGRHEWDNERMRVMGKYPNDAVEYVIPKLIVWNPIYWYINLCRKYPIIPSLLMIIGFVLIILGMYY